MWCGRTPGPASEASAADTNGIAIGHDLASSSAWLGLVVNILIAEWYIQRRFGVPKPKPALARSAQQIPATVEAR